MHRIIHFSPSKFLLTALLLTGFLAGGLVTQAVAQEIVFGRDIRPILSDRCFACHGPAREGQENELRLDERDFALEGAIIPGNPAESPLIQRITSTDPDLQMPPPSFGKPAFRPEEVDLLTRWIQQGAQYTGHWAYQPVTRPQVPQVSDPDWPAGEIDRFTLKTMESRGLKPSAPADRRTLARRLSFDLTGLPPTPEVVQAFQADESPDAVEKLVDRLLESEHFGERMAVFWLDLVRYADTGGYHSDNEREVDAYRDYVIQAFNSNLPFDQFTREQLAGDLLPNATVWQKVASGYNRLLQTTEEGGAQPKEYTAIYQADRVRNVSDVWLASTLACCQCHDHKYDPFTTRDFYSLAAFFADIQEKAVGRQDPNLRVPTEEQSAQLARLTAELESLRQAPVFAEQLSRWSSQMQGELARSKESWTPMLPSILNSRQGQTLMVQDDLSILASGKNPDADEYVLEFPLEESTLTALRLEVLTHESLSKGKLSRANGNFVLTGFEVSLKGENSEPVPIKILKATADFEQPGFPVTSVIDADPKSGWAVDGHNNPANHLAMFAFEAPLQVTSPAVLQVTLKHQSSHAKHNIGRFRISRTALETPPLEPGQYLPASLAQVLDKNFDSLNNQDRTALEAAFRERSAEHAPVRERISEVEKQLASVNGSVRTMLVAQSLDNPRMVRILPRGNWLDDSGTPVEPAIPVRLGALNVEGRRPNRLDLADWIVNSQNPLTSRVFVNRVWKLLFGRGLATVEDFGFQGDWPTHPDLLDWLAAEFMDSGWNVKHLMRSIVLSRTYQQSAVSTASQRQFDPDNKWLARQGRFRLDAEFVRDNALAVSGLLVNDLGGRTVKPYQPRGYWQHLNFPQREWENSQGASQYRRGLYTFWCRSFLHPSLAAFDAPSREECTAQRPRSNTPLQALVLLNDPTYVEAARVLATQIVSQPGDDSEKLRFAFQQVLQRDPSQQERQVLLEVLSGERSRLAQNSAEAKAILENGLAPNSNDLVPEEVASWTAVSRVLLNLHETINRS